MEDAEVVRAFVEGSAITAFGSSLHVENDTLKLDGWWSIAYRVSDRTVIVRDEETPTDSTALADVTAALTARGLTAVGSDLPAITLLTYTNLDLGYAPWVLWSSDLDTGETDLNAKAMEDTSLQGGSPGGTAIDSGDPNYVRGARRTAGVATQVVLTVGLTDDQTDPLRKGLDDCRIESRALGEVAPGDCASLLPTMVVVDATGSAGRDFVAGLQADRAFSGPVVAVTGSGAMEVGADATVDAAGKPDSWLPLIRNLLA